MRAPALNVIVCVGRLFPMSTARAVTSPLLSSRTRVSIRSLTFGALAWHGSTSPDGTVTTAAAPGYGFRNLAFRSVAVLQQFLILGSGNLGMTACDSTRPREVNVMV